MYFEDIVDQHDTDTYSKMLRLLFYTRKIFCCVSAYWNIRTR